MFATAITQPADHPHDKHATDKKSRRARLGNQNRTFIPGVGVQVERPAVGVDPEGAELLRRAVADGGAPGPAVEPEHERRGLRGHAGRLDEPVEEGPPRGRVHGDVAGVHGEVDRRLARQAADAVRLRRCRRGRCGRRAGEQR